MKNFFMNFLFVFFLFIQISSLFAQKFGNEWIDYDKTYYKVTLADFAAEGIYKIGYADLQKAGFPVETTDPKRIQMFSYGEEIAINIFGQEDGKFDPQDYIEFYGRYPNNYLDRLMYDSPKYIANNTSSLSDARKYFYLVIADNDKTKRMEVVEDQVSLPLENSAQQISYNGNATRFAWGALFPNYIISNRNTGAITTHFTEGKGTIDQEFLAGETRNMIHNLQDLKDSMPEIELELMIVGRSNTPHRIEVYVSSPLTPRINLGLLDFNNYEVMRKKYRINNLKFSPPNSQLTLTFVAQRFSRAEETVAYVYSKAYSAQGFNVEGAASKKLLLYPKNTGTSRVQFQNMLAGTRIFDLTDTFNIRIIKHNPTQNTATITQNQISRLLYLESKNLAPEKIEAMKFKVLEPIYDYLILTHPYLQKPAGEHKDITQAYADYRSSPEGGNYKATVVNVLDLYEQFTYGEIHPLAYRRYVDYMFKKGANPKFLFLMGKGMKLIYFRNYFQPNSWNSKSPHFVMPYGFPSSDNEITESLNGSLRHVAALGTGRLAARNPDDILAYFNKVKEHEKITDQSWRKNVLHLSGGYDASQTAKFKEYIDNFKSIAENDFLGAKVATLSKKTTDYVEPISIKDELNGGLGLITFFGHSNFEYTDVEVGKVSDVLNGYNNKGKYPMIVLNGCGSGDIFEDSQSNSENWILTPEKGAILYLANTYLGFDQTLFQYTSNFYRHAFADKNLIGKPMGTVLLEASKTFSKNFQDEVSIAHLQQFVLHGDPAIKFFYGNLPDYAISGDKIFVRSANNKSVTAQSDAFNMEIVISNLGLVDANKDSVAVLVRRTFSDGSSEIYKQKFRYIKNQETLIFQIKNSEEAKKKAKGLNQFEIVVDPESLIVEVTKANNRALFEYSFPQGTVVTITPKEYSIVNTQPVIFVAQNTNPLTEERLYRFQVDTTHLFNSPLLKDTTVFGYITPQLTLKNLASSKDSTVFYWRVRMADLAANDDPNWAESSFIYIKNSPDGWSQSHFHQFTNSNLNGIGLDTVKRKFEFTKAISNIKIKTLGGASPDWTKYFIEINGAKIAESGTCRETGRSPTNDGTNRLILVSIDANTGKIYNNTDVYTCGASLLATNFDQFAAWYKDAELVQDYFTRIKTGDYVIIINGRNVRFDQMPINVFSPIGGDSKKFRSRTNASLPYIILGRKGAPEGSATEIFSTNLSSSAEINFDTLIQHFADQGTITSSIIGPAKKWTNLHRKLDQAEDPSKESWQLDVLGVDYKGKENIVARDVKENAFDLQGIDVGLYPYLKLRASLKDVTNRTPYQLKKWQVVYQEVPEGILLYDSTSYRENTVLEIIQGDSIRIGFYFANLTATAFDQKITVRYTIYNALKNLETIIYDTLAPLKANGIVRFYTKKLHSLDYFGDNKLTVFVNPRILAEQSYDNNVIEARFRVKRDDINPILNVVFDGKHLIDGEIVSPNPLIAINLKDGDRLFPIKDTTSMEIYLARCEGCKLERIYMNSSVVNYTIKNNELQVDYRPKTLPNGTYTLIAQGIDASGNKAGTNPYRITFKVINESTISNFYLYPNPFSTNAKFVFSLTGKIPDDLQIQILTITGKVIRTISKQELGNLRVGNNISDFSWDGTDEFGDQLANGVYLYKVDVKTEGEEFKHFETSKDNLFKEGYGKVYLMR
ncbi:MAG: T9SS C-terminal target domain-containing protein [Bacteroidetes bacterium]|nr:MAG: T9SS C-terminal target domain-containing protein [Bacteroidota bacterium]